MKKNSIAIKVYTAKPTTVTEESKFSLLYMYNMSLLYRVHE